MATVVQLPRLSDTMEEGVIAKWRIKVGDKVKRGQVIAEIETDKATMEFESFDSGVVLKLIATEGETLPLGAPIAVLGQAGESPDGASAGAGASVGASEPAAATPAAEASKPAAAAEASKPAPAVAEAAASSPEGQVAKDMSKKPAGDGARVPASPLARRLAREHDLELGEISGSGPHGRVVKADVDQAIAAAGKAPATAAAAGTSAAAAPVRGDAG